MDAKDYLADPCGASSLSFWKTERVVVPENMRIMRDDLFDAAQYAAWHDERYFKLRCELSERKRPALPAGYELICPDTEAYARHICGCYDAEGVSAAELEAYRAHDVYDPALWVAVAAPGGELAASGVAELDTRIGEGVLEWIQVSPSHRRRGLGTFVVCELLRRMKENGAAFATVSGKLNSASDPLALYEVCGFRDAVVWHILTK
ncbi:MAG: GNAT family N-acetyltransferase [Oscillospiraceae bacterium]|nr:GNAT family N-acetyltransferase [Oscillospiraceae bacterium]